MTKTQPAHPILQTPMKALIEYIESRSIRGACTCEYCHNESINPVQINLQPENGHQTHTIDLIFFKVAINPANLPNSEDLRKLVAASNQTADVKLDLFDGKEHNYLTIAKWIGDRQIGLTLMGLGYLLHLWTMQTPALVHHNVTFQQSTLLALAEAGCISITST